MMNSDYSSQQNSNAMQTRMPEYGIPDDENNAFDPDERQIRILLKQNLKHFNMNGTIDFEKLTRELQLADRNQSGLLNRQQMEEVVYKVRIPIQRSMLFQILEKNCRAFANLYR